MSAVSPLLVKLKLFLVFLIKGIFATASLRMFLGARGGEIFDFFHPWVRTARVKTKKSFDVVIKLHELRELKSPKFPLIEINKSSRTFVAARTHRHYLRLTMKNICRCFDV